uniref:C2H2-type domain-containing protein n=1 Tax=Xiphophorus couchianus TaxID=32473 RepID=A0A3B5MAH6_9TELE
MWHVVKQKDVMNYWKVQEFVCMVTDAVPHLINQQQRAQLLLGLRARVSSSFSAKCMDPDVKTTQLTFVALVQSLLKDPAERAYFFQEVFPAEYGQQYDAALQVLLWELLSKLEKLLPIPDLKQVQLHGPCSTTGSCIMSALSVPPSQKSNLSIGQDSVDNYANTLTRITLAEAGQCSVVAFYTEVEVRASDLDAESAEIQVQTECYEEEIVALSAGVSGGGEEETGEAAGVAKALETLTKTFALRKESLGSETGPLSFTGEKFIPSPSCSDEIFTSIKLFPKGNAESQDGGPQAHSRKKSLTCETCGKTFTRTSDVRRHQLTHTGERPFHCSQCDRTFQHSWDLAKHESKHHGVAISFSCQLCGGSFANLRALTVHHKKSHSSESQLPHICSICSRGFPTDDELLEHRKSHVSIRRYICQQCGDGFDTLLARAQHRQAHRVKRQFKCPQCEKTYTRRSDVKRHLSTHTGERPHQCKQCNKRFSVRFMLVKHLRVHTGERPFHCSHCSKSFTLASVLARHERMHTGEKPFLCSQCGKGFLSQGELSKHHRSHLDDRPYPCLQCEKRFKSKKTQQEHIASHSGARPYPCTHCGKGFSKPYALTRHNLIHTGERPFPCGHCEKSFLTSSELARHKRSHSGQRREKPTSLIGFTNNFFFR